MKKPQDMVIKSNTLIEASYSLTVQEIRLLDIALADLATYDECEKGLLTMHEFVHIRADEYAKIYDVDMSTAYTALREASETLFTRYFTYNVQSEAFPTHQEHRKARWVWNIAYVEGQGLVKLAFTPDLIELAGKLKGDFSRYHLKQKAPLTSVYAHRLYEMMMQWRKSKVVPSISYNELRHRFDIDDKEYKRMDNFKSRALDPAIRQINDSTDITVSYKQYKEGRKIAGFIFKFQFKDEKKEPLKTISKNVDNTKSNTDSSRLTPEKIPAMTENQRNTFAHKLLNNFDFIRDYNAQTIGKSREQLLLWVEQQLVDDDKRQELRKYLLLVGYKFPDHNKK